MWKSLLGALALFALFATPAAAECSNLNVYFSEPLAMPYQIDHDNCGFYWDKGDHAFDYQEVLELVAEYNSTTTTAIAVGGYWCNWLVDIQEAENYFDYVAYLRCGGKGT